MFVSKYTRIVNLVKVRHAAHIKYRVHNILGHEHERSQGRINTDGTTMNNLIFVGRVDGVAV